ncbi:MAG: hypothetical protein AAFO81_12170 [Pseudomonadota bacterium]
MSLTATTLTRISFLLLAWIAPALIAGALRWPALWGSGSALVDYLLPLPLTGGVIHLPSFAVFVAVLVIAERWPRRVPNLPAIAFCVCALAISLQIDFARLNDVVFTDLQSSKPVKFGRNPLWLFIASDTFWLGVWALTKRIRTMPKTWFAIPLAPLAVIGVSALRYVAAPAQFEAGTPVAASIAGQQQQLVYTNSDFDETALRDWLAQSSHTRPWATPNAQHAAIYFVRSRNKVAHGDFADLHNSDTIATLCLYEEDKRTDVHAGYRDCFAGRQTLVQRLNQARAKVPARVDRDFSKWYAQLAVCEGLRLEKERADNIEHVDHCLGMRRRFSQDLLALKKRYGRTAREVRLAQALGTRVGFDNKN